MRISRYGGGCLLYSVKVSAIEQSTFDLHHCKSDVDSSYYVANVILGLNISIEVPEGLKRSYGIERDMLCFIEVLI